MTVSILTGTTAAVAEVFGERFFASHGTVAEAIAISVAFGIAAEISRSLAPRE